MNNDFKITIELTSSEVRDLMLACTLSNGLCYDSSKWDNLRCKLDTSYNDSISKIPDPLND